MKSITTIIILFSGFWSVSEDYEKVKVEITRAVETRNFVHVKELLSDLMPLIRNDLKKTKSDLSVAKKSGNEQVFSSLKETYQRKATIYKSLDHLLDVSPAAVRARSSQIVRFLEEYDKLSVS